MTTQSWTISGAEGQPILGDTHLPRDGGRAIGTLLICHGFKGYKDYGFFPLLAEQAAAVGLVAHRFNFSHGGMTNRIETFERPELFEADTWGKQIYDLGCVSRAASEGRLPGATKGHDNNKATSLPQVIFGHSRGGVTTLLTAARHFAPAQYGLASDTASALGQTPAGLILAAAPHQACSLDEDQRRLLRGQGWLASPSSRTGQDLRVGKSWLTEIEAEPAKFDPVMAAAHIRCPALILHGQSDTTVPVASARELTAAIPGSTPRVIAQAGHTFNASNPLTGQAPPATMEMIEVTLAFALECCGKSPYRSVAWRTARGPLDESLITEDT